MPLDRQIEAILFYKAEPVKIKRLAEILEKSEDEIKAGLQALSVSLTERGLKIVSGKDTVMLGTDPSLSQLIEKINKEELSEELGKAGLETLSLILYKGPISKKDIDYVRGVNSSFILRNLLIRGLIEKNIHEDGRSSIYSGSLETLAFMGLKNIEELPEYNTVKEKLEELRTKQNEEQKIQ